MLGYLKVIGAGLALGTSLVNAAPTYKSFLYRHGDAGFSMNLTSKHLILQDYAGHFAIERKPCNRVVVNRFWDDLSKRVSRLPKSRTLASLASDKLVRATLVADGRAHGLSLLDREMKSLDLIGRSFRGLMLEEARTCQGHK